MILFLAHNGFGAAKNASTPVSQDSSIERMRLENERMKLENDRLKMQIEREKLKAKTAATTKPPKADVKEVQENQPIVVSSPKKYIGLEIGRIRSEASADSQAKAEEIKDDATRVVLDFTNGELWYKGVRSSMNDFPELAKREGWKTKTRVEKRRSNGYAKQRTTYKNLSAAKYEMRDKGTFTWTASLEEGALAFDTPEGVSSESSYDEFRNNYENTYFTYEKSKSRDGLTWLFFKHRVDFKNWSEKLQFGFDKEGKLARIDWGILDEN
jgi:hypothetical protein